MFTPLLALSIAGVTHAAPPVVTLKGGVAVVQGILQDSPSPDNLPHTLHIKVGANINTYNNVYIVVDPSSDFLGQGAQCLLVLQGSTPLIANFSVGAITVDEALSAHPAASEKSIGISSTGQLQASFIMQQSGRQDGVLWTWPSFSLNGLSFPNGASGKWNAYPGLFDLTLPTAGVNTQQTISFPAGTAHPLFFQFHASGAGSDLLMLGSGYTSPLTVSGTITGSNMVMARANLDITGG